MNRVQGRNRREWGYVGRTGGKSACPLPPSGKPPPLQWKWTAVEKEEPKLEKECYGP